MQWWGAAAKMVIFNINNKVLTIVFTGLVRWGNMGFSWKSESHSLVSTGPVCL